MGDHQGQEGIIGKVDDGGLQLPPGFRFHPSDEEIITFYLIPKVLNRDFTAVAIGEVNLNKSEPWELPMKAKMGENEWYFYSLKDQKYQKGERVNRATNAGFWKATGKDKKIYQATALIPTIIGMKKTLVFYTGRAPNGKKTEWVMHEFRLEGSGKLCPATGSNSIVTKEEWVVCKVFKSSRNKDAPTSSFHEAMASDDTDEGIMSFPTSMQFPMGQEDFSYELNALCPLMDPTMSFYSTIGASSSVEPSISPMASMGTLDLEDI